MLKELIDQFYLDKEKDREQNHFYITDAGKCTRAIFFKFKNITREKMEARMLRLFDHGDYIQMQLLNTLFSLGLVRSSEVQIPPQALISGRADAIITLNNELYVVDFKSMNSMIFRKLEAPKEENINQIQLYMHYFGIPKGILLYMSKDTSELKDFPIEYDVDRVKGLLNGLEDLDKKIKANIVPEQMSDFPRNKQCVYCQFKDICVSAGKSELKWDEFKKKIEKLGE
ncbi:MAG: PD-(D/E)XK nuclease family protein [Patescibacteria group bacterium]